MKKYEEYLYLQNHPIGSNSDLFVYNMKWYNII